MAQAAQAGPLAVQGFDRAQGKALQPLQPQDRFGFRRLIRLANLLEQRAVFLQRPDLKRAVEDAAQPEADGFAEHRLVRDGDQEALPGPLQRFSQGPQLQGIFDRRIFQGRRSDHGFSR
jgi:hypothetical protein